MKHRVVNGIRNEAFIVSAPTFEECKKEALRIVELKGWADENCYNEQIEPDPFFDPNAIRKPVYHKHKLVGCAIYNLKNEMTDNTQRLCHQCGMEFCKFENVINQNLY